MRKSIFKLAMLAAILAPGGLAAQVPIASRSPMAAAIGTIVTAAEIETMVARAKREMKPDAPLSIQPLMRFLPYTAFLEYRRGAWTAATHPDIEMFFIVRGTGTFVSGGRLVDAKPGSGGNMSAATIVDGTMRKIGGGDFLVVPAGMPHMFPKPDGELVMISMHVPGEPAK